MPALSIIGVMAFEIAVMQFRVALRLTDLAVMLKRGDYRPRCVFTLGALDKSSLVRALRVVARFEVSTPS